MNCLNILTVFALCAVCNGTVSAEADRGDDGLLLVYKDDDIPVVNAEFTFFKVGEISLRTENGKAENVRSSLITGISSIPEEISGTQYIDAVHEAYESGSVQSGFSFTAETDESGILFTDKIENGIYLVEETVPAEGYAETSPFLIQYPDISEKGSRVLSVFPKAVPCGELKITKRVTGDTGEKNRTFHITVELDDYEGECGYTQNSGDTGIFRSGDRFSLKAEDSVVITGIPAGTEYYISEEEADSEGYRTTFTAGNGRIAAHCLTEAIVTNDRGSIPDTSDEIETAVYRILFAGSAICTAGTAAMLIFKRSGHA